MTTKTTTCRTCGFIDCPSLTEGGECPRWATEPTTSTKPLRVVWHVLFEGMRDEVASCPDCYFHFEDGTVTLCEPHASLTIIDMFDRL